MCRTWLPIGVLGGALALAPVALLAHGDNHQAHAAQQAAMGKLKATPGGAAEVKIADLELVDSHGRTLHFKSDVIGDKLVALTVLYTSCTTVCPGTSAIFAQLQQRLGARLGDTVRLVALTVDPATDTPERLNAYAKQFHAGPDWVWLTGGKRAIETVLEGVGAYTPNFRDHPSMVLVGDGRTQQWQRFFGFPSPDQLLGALDALEQARGDGAPVHAKAAP